MAGLEEIQGRMGADWDRRAREDAQYYVAFGRRSQTPEEFFSSAADVLREIRSEYRRFLRGTQLKNLRALEIGCGPGRLMLPLSHDFGRVSGVDVSAEMIELARRNLASVPHADLRVGDGATLPNFDDESVDLVYSYAVFQHIPSRAVVLSYLAEAVRVLRPGGLLKVQVNSLPQSGPSGADPVRGWSLRSGTRRSGPVLMQPPDTWSGVSFQGEELAAFCAANGMRVLAMDGFETQYLWLTARKGSAGTHAPGLEPAPRIAAVSNSFTGDKLVPQSGRFASSSLWVRNLPEAADLNSLRVEIDGVATAPSYVGPRDSSGGGQVNVYLPPGVRTGMVPIALLLDGRRIGAAALMRVTPSASRIPRLISVTDGINLLSDLSIENRLLKIHIEDVPYLDASTVAAAFHARLDEVDLPAAAAFCVDPLARRFELNLSIPDELASGPHNLFCTIGERRLGHVGLQVA